MRRISSLMLAAVMLMAASFSAAAEQSRSARSRCACRGSRARGETSAVHLRALSRFGPVGRRRRSLHRRCRRDVSSWLGKGTSRDSAGISWKKPDRKSAGLGKGQLYLHLLLQPIITLGADGKTAKGTWHQVAMFGQYGKSASWAGGIYENEYALDEGVWKIRSIHFYPQYAGTYDEYGHKAPARWDIPYHFEAKHVGVTIPGGRLAGAALGFGECGTARAACSALE